MLAPEHTLVLASLLTLANRMKQSWSVSNLTLLLLLVDYPEIWWLILL